MPLAAATAVKKSTTAATAAAVSATSRLKRAAARVRVCSCAAVRRVRGVLRGRRFDRHHRLPQFEEGHIVQRQRAAHARADAPRLRAGDPQPLLAAPAAEQTVGLQFADGLADGRAVDAELTRQIRFRGQGIAGAQRARDDALLDEIGDLAVGRVIVERQEQIGHSALSEQLAPDEHAADLGGAGADLIQLGVAQQAAGADSR